MIRVTVRRVLLRSGGLVDPFRKNLRVNLIIIAAFREFLPAGINKKISRKTGRANFFL